MTEDRGVDRQTSEARGSSFKYLRICVAAEVIAAVVVLVVGVFAFLALPSGERCDGEGSAGATVFFFSGGVAFVAVLAGTAALIRIGMLWGRDRRFSRYFGSLALRLVLSMATSAAVYIAWGAECLTPGLLGV